MSHETPALEDLIVDLPTWEAQRAGLLQRIRKALGTLPDLPAQVEAQVLEVRQHPLGTLEKVRLDNGTSIGIPAWFASPSQSNAPGPAVLWCHWHGGEYDAGKQALFEQNHTPEPPLDAFLRMGRSVLCIDAYGFGERQGKDPESCGDLGQEGEHSLCKAFLWQGSSLWGRMLWDDRMALQYLRQRSEVDPKRLAAAGLSMGATRAQWLMAFEPELACGVAIACLVRYADLIRSKALNRHGMYFFVPGMLEVCDLESVLALAAPRPLLCMNGAEDALSPQEGIRTIQHCLSKVYQLYGCPEAFESIVAHGVGHACTPAMWQSMQAWIGKV